MSEQVIQSLAESVPNLVVFVALVVFFLRGQKSAADRFDVYMRSRDEKYDVVVSENTDVIKENSKILGQVIEVIRDGTA